MEITLDDLVLSLIAAVIGPAIILPATYLVVDRIIARNDIPTRRLDELL